MNVEQHEALRRRAARHAALSDPARLAIVDTLSLGDASPSELQSLLAIPSNLLAHHLRALESVGMLVRTRSQSDRRRTYVRLSRDALAGLTPESTRSAARVVFVCTANSARSQLAAALWRRASAIPAVSAGTHPATSIDPGVVAVARRHDLPLRARRPRGLDEVLAERDFLITVCDHAHEEMGWPAADVHWSVPDPVHIGTDDAFDDAFEEIAQRVSDLAPRLTAS